MRYVRIILTVLTGVALVILGLVAALYAFVTPERVAARISAVLERDLGLIVTPASPLRIDRLPKLRVTFPETEIALVGETSHPGRFKSAVITLSPFVYFAQSPRIDDISINGLALNFSRNNLLQHLSQQSQTRRFFNIDTLTVTDGSLHITEYENTLFSAENLRLSLRDINEKGAGAAAFALINAGTTSGSTDLRGVFNWETGLLSASLTGLEAHLKGLQNGETVDLTLNAASLSSPLTERWNVQNLSLQTNLPYGMNALIEIPRLDVSGKVFTATHLTSVVTRKTDTGTEYLRGKTVLRIDTDTQAIKIQDFSLETSQLSEAEKAPEPTGSLKGDIDWNALNGTGHVLFDGVYRGTPMQSTLALNRTENRRLTVTGNIHLGRIAPTSIGRQLPALRPLMTNVDASLDFIVGADDNILALQKLTGHLALTENEAVVTKGFATIRSNLIPFSARLHENGTWSIQAQWQGLPAAPFFETPVLTGQSEGQLKASGMLGKPEHSKATLLFSVNDGEFFGADLPDVLRVMTDEQPDVTPLSLFTPTARTPFDTLTFNAVKDARGWLLKNGQAQAPDWSAVFTGETRQENTALKSAVRFLKADGRDAFTLPAEIFVTRAAPPIWHPDWQTAHREAVQKNGELPWNVKRLKDRALRELDNWWKEFNVEKLELPKFDLPSLPEINLPEWLSKFGENEKTNAPELPI